MIVNQLDCLTRTLQYYRGGIAYLPPHLYRDLLCPILLVRPVSFFQRISSVPVYLTTNAIIQGQLDWGRVHL